MIDHYHFSYSGILSTLKYWYEIKGNSIAKANEGLGIVPYVYSDAKKYYESIFYATQLNKDITNYENEKKIIIISSPRVDLQCNKLFDFKSLEDRMTDD